ncbi:MAG: InlB B-repeat-containing protein [Firmicutes bacterium]|nr:InlB B-repeat-containing protein [Bacillota bacterium]
MARNSGGMAGRVAGIALALCVLLSAGAAGLAEEGKPPSPGMAGPMTEAAQDGADRTPRPPRYSVRFVDDSLFSLYFFWVFEGETAPRPEEPVKEGFLFEGWMNAVTKEDFDLETPITEHMQLQARYAPAQPRPAESGGLNRDLTGVELMDLVNVLLGKPAGKAGGPAAGNAAPRAEDQPRGGLLSEGRAPAGPGGEQAQSADAGAADPAVWVTVAYSGDETTGGTLVTLTAHVGGVPEGAARFIQWQNNAGGEYMDVPGVTGETITFAANEWNTACGWRAKVALNPAE